MSCVDDWWDAQQVELPFDEDEPETDDGFCGEYLSESWWRRPWPIYKETAHANVLPDLDRYGKT